MKREYDQDFVEISKARLNKAAQPLAAMSLARGLAFQALL